MFSKFKVENWIMVMTEWLHVSELWKNINKQYKDWQTACS